MKLLADENVPAAAVAGLRAAGHDVVWIRTANPGVSDLEVIASASRQDRLILTFDKDFGELARQEVDHSPPGVILVRLPMRPPAEMAAYLAATLDSRSDWLGHFSVLEPGRIRMRAMIG
jgi:predicted nuclease of predicted toxin-antitoxin system